MGTKLEVNIPAQTGGWWHQYVCPTHHEELEEPVNTETGVFYPCPKGCQLVGKAYEGAWMVYTHQHFARLLRLTAQMANSAKDFNKRQEKINLGLEILHKYRRIYEKLSEDSHKDAQDWMLKGTLFHQALTEAIWATNLCLGIRTLIEVVEKSDIEKLTQIQTSLPFLKKLYLNLEKAKERLVHERKEFHHNYTAWLNAGMVCTKWILAYFEKEHKQGYQNLISGEYGVYKHILTSIYDDGWEYEGSTYYHVFVLRAYLLSLRGADWEGIPEEVRTRLKRMIQVIYNIACEDGTLPALHDSPYQRTPYDLEILEVMAIARRIYDSDQNGVIQKKAIQNLGAEWDKLETILGDWMINAPYEKNNDRKEAVLFQNMGYAVFRSPKGFQAIVDYGPHGGSHGQLDKLSLYLFGQKAKWQPPKGVPPYGSDLKKGYYFQTGSHPTFQLNGNDQAETRGECLHWSNDANETYGVFRTELAYQGVVADRHIKMVDGMLIDLLVLQTKQPSDFQLNFRPNGQFDIENPIKSFHYESEWLHEEEKMVGMHYCNIPASLEQFGDYGTADCPMDIQNSANWLASGAEVMFGSVYKQNEKPEVNVKLSINKVIFKNKNGTILFQL